MIELMCKDETIREYCFKCRKYHEFRISGIHKESDFGSRKVHLTLVCDEADYVIKHQITQNLKLVSKLRKEARRSDKELSL